MAASKKYPKSFYDDGLGDILDWIDDEVLINSRDTKESAGSKNKKKRTKNLDSNIENVANRKKNSTKNLKLYGDNEIEEKPSGNKVKKVKWDLIEAEDAQEPDTESSTGDTKKLDDRVRGLINRLAAQTMPFVTSEFEKIYSSNSRSSVTNSIFKNIESSVITKHSLTKRKLVAELMLLVSYLDGKISHSIGASLVHRLVVKFENFYKNGTSDEDKQLDNITCCIVNLYMIGLISCNIIFEFTNRICCREDFRTKSIELLLIVVESVGFQLRKDNPTKMRQLILLAHENCDRLKLDSKTSGSRVEFMIDALSALKNNNINKIGNYGCNVDKETIETTLKSLIQRTKLPETLSDATYEEILNSANWYVLETRLEDQSSSDSKSAIQPIETNSKSERKICKALGLNKPTERTIFSALLKVSDYVEASNIIIGYGMNYCSDAMIVSIHVAIHEKKYNQFYFDLINNLCKFNRKYKMAAKFAIQDKIRVLNEMPIKRVDMFKRLCFELIQSDAIPITILKAIEWANLNDSTKIYLTYTLESISALPEEEKKKIMLKVDKKSSFAGAIRTFSNCFLKDCLLFD